MERRASEAAENSVLEFVKKYKITGGKVNEREWGSYDLIMQGCTHSATYVTTATFGYGYTPERASAITLYRLGCAPVPNSPLETWLGKGPYSELVQLCVNVNKLDALKAEIDKETAIEEIEKSVSERLHNGME